MSAVAIPFFKRETWAQSYLDQGCNVMQKGPRSSLRSLCWSVRVNLCLHSVRPIQENVFSTCLAGTAGDRAAWPVTVQSKVFSTHSGLSWHLSLTALASLTPPPSKARETLVVGGRGWKIELKVGEVGDYCQSVFWVRSLYMSSHSNDYWKRPTYPWSSQSVFQLGGGEGIIRPHFCLMASNTYWLTGERRVQFCQGYMRFYF